MDNIRELSLREQGQLEAVRLAGLPRDERDLLYDAVLAGRGEEVAGRIQDVYAAARPTDFTDLFPGLPDLPAHRAKLEPMSDESLIAAYMRSYEKIANSPKSESSSRLVMGQTSFGDVLYENTQKSLKRHKDTQEYNEDELVGIQRVSRDVFSVESNFDDIIADFVIRIGFMRKIANAVRNAGHEVIYFDAVVEISELILSMMRNSIVRNFFLDKKSLVYFMATRRVIDRFIFDAALELLDSTNSVTGKAAIDLDVTLIIREQACIQSIIDQLSSNARVSITNLLKRSGLLIQIGSLLEGLSSFPKFEGDYDRFSDRVKYGLDIFSRKNPQYKDEKDKISHSYNIVRLNSWRKYVIEFLEAQFLLGKIA